MNTILKHNIVTSVKWNKSFSIFSLAAGMATAGFGLMTMIAWLFDLPLVASFGSGRIPMAPSTALLLLLYGTAACLRIRWWSNRRARWLAVSMVMLGILVAFTLLVLSWLGIQWSGEHLGMSITGELAKGTPIGHMSRITAYCFLLAGGSFLASLSPAIPRWRAALAMISAGTLLGVGYVFLLSYVLGTPLLYGTALIPPALNTTLSFITLGLTLVAVIPRKIQSLTGVRTDGHSNPTFSFLIIFVILILSIIAGGYAYYKNSEQQYRDEVQHQLTSIADLKVNELSQYRRERLADATTLHNNPTVTRLVRRFLESPADSDAKQQLQTWLGKYQSHYDYDLVRLVDDQGVTRLSIPEGLQPISGTLVTGVASSLQTGQPVFMDFYKSENDQRVYLAILVPILDETDQYNPLGVLVLRINPATYLYPYIKRWPVPSKTAETLIVRKEGEDVLFLNELRFWTGAPLSLRIPITNNNNPAVQAVQGYEGPFEGIDYRGVPVLAEVRAIPNSPWFLVARRDLVEILEPLHRLLWQVIVMTGILLLGSGLGVLIVSRQQSIRYYRKQAEMGEALLQSQDLRNEAEKLGRVGAWDIDIVTQQLSWTEMVYDIHELDRTVRPTLEQGVNFYTPESRPIIEKAVQRAIEHGEPFDLELEIITAKGNLRNVHAIGKADQPRRKISGFFQDITEQKTAVDEQQRLLEQVDRDRRVLLSTLEDQLRTQEALRQSEAMVKAVLDNLPIGVAVNSVDPEVLFNYMNDNFPLFYRTTREMLEVPDNFWNAVYEDPEFREVMKNRVLQSIATGDPDLMHWETVPITRKGEKTKYVNARNVQVPGKPLMISTVWDITELLMAEQDKQKFFLLAESSSEFIGMCDLELQPLYVNPAGQRIVGLPDLEAACRVKVPDYFFPEDRAFIANEFFPKVLRDGHGSVEIRLCNFQTGEPIWVYYYLFSVKDFAGKPIGWATVSRDITERRKAEEEIRQLNAVLEQRITERTKQLRDVNSELQAFTYSVSHDLKAPLRGIDGYSKLLLELYGHKLEEEPRLFLNNICRGTQQMNQLINDLLAYSRLERSQLKPKEIIINSLINEIIEPYKTNVQNEGIRFSTRVETVTILTDLDGLSIAMRNIIENAIKFTRYAEKPLIEITTEQTADAITIGVKDNGIGFDMKFHNKIFEIFQRLHRAEDYPGTGIGLALVAKTIRRMGGTVWAESEPGSGAAFYIKIPTKLKIESNGIILS